jgi:hypothetical protein
MSFSIALDRSRPDLRIVGGRLTLSTGAQAVRDRLFVALSTARGEWFLNVREGLPYGDILGGKLQLAEVSALVRRRILEDPEVSRIVSVEVTADAARRVSVQCEVLTSAGESAYIEV